MSLLESCHDEDREEEDDDDETPNGGGDPKTETCTDRLEVSVKPESTQSKGSSNLGPPGVTPTPIPSITVSVESRQFLPRFLPLIVVSSISTTLALA